MKREYASGKEENITVFIGREIEHTPAYGMDTLFIVGLLSVDQIQEYLDDYSDIEHIFFGANHSFNGGDYEQWEDMILHFLTLGYLCSLDIPMAEVETFNDFSFNEYNNFIPQIRIPLPYVSSWNYNTMIKIDDKDFDYSNPGVWSHSLHDLKDRKCFTPWNRYSLDTIIK